LADISKPSVISGFNGEKILALIETKLLDKLWIFWLQLSNWGSEIFIKFLKVIDYTRSLQVTAGSIFDSINISSQGKAVKRLLRNLGSFRTAEIKEL